MNRLASLRFDRVLDDGERAEAERVARSAGAAAGSWSVQAQVRRTYALLALEEAADARALGTLLRALVHEPPLVVLSVTPERFRDLGALRAALGGAGRPAGLLDCSEAGDALLLELDDTLTPLSLVVDLIDVVVCGQSRTIVPVLGLRDETLSAFAGAILAEPDLDASRLIETWLARIVQAPAAK